MIKIEHDTSTGQVTEIELTAAEITEIETKAKQSTDAKVSQAAAKTALLEKLGISESEAALLLS